LEPVIKNNDLLGIQIFSKSMNQDQVAIFNIPAGGANIGNQVANTGNQGASASSQGYLVGMNGNIDLPIIGDVRAAGLTIDQLQFNLKQKLSFYVKDPSVLVRFLEFKINILGEVKLPGTHNFDKNRVTIIDAISAAGDLTDYGKRNDVIVIREGSKDRKVYRVDLRSGALFQSPVYQLQPNDIIYVGANHKKLKSLNSDPESQKGWQLLFGITSVVSTLVTLLITIKR
jgi:polysaccharide export outer membrane protein